jgi:hypothetical protein
MLYAISESLGGTQFIKNEVTDAEKSTGEYKEVKDKFSPLNGRFVHRDVYEAITNQNIYESDNIWMSGYLTTLQLARKSKVIYNLPTWRKNLTGGWYTMAANGVINPSIVRDIKRRAQLFANGGIVSGPTLGLMGEYPGARNNPEVVAPLDKLKGMMGAGMGGSLSARISGNDLLILMNKAARNNQTTF